MALTVPSVQSPGPEASGPYPPENILNYDAAVDDFLADLPLNEDAQNGFNIAQPAKDIDEEITVKKKRKPVPKLDADLLLSHQGIPRLRKITKSRLKFRGKGYEFSDISRLLNTYQLWLDDLYPRAKFKDALAIVEKVGHSKRMQVTRKAWIDETKPHQRDASPHGIDDDFVMSGALPSTEADVHGNMGMEEESDNAIFGRSTSNIEPIDNGALRPDDTPGEDDLDALLAQNEPTTASTSAQPQRKRGPFDDDSDDEDELDALLAEQPFAGPNN